MSKTETAHGYIAKDAYRRYRYGDKIDNESLLIAMNYFEQVANMLYPLGEEFRLQASEANRVHYALRGYAKARGLLDG